MELVEVTSPDLFKMVSVLGEGRTINASVVEVEGVMGSAEDWELDSL